MKRKGLLCAGCAAAALLMAPAAKADPRTHDGFFLRLGLNMGYGGVTETVEANGQQVYELSLNGITSGFDLLLGGTLGSGFVLGGAWITTFAVNPSGTFNVGGVEQDVETDGTMLTSNVALFVNYHVDPSDGFNLQGLVGFGVIDFVRDDAQSGGGDSPSGPVFGLGLGYDFWVSDEWSIGPFGRVLFGAYGDEASGATASDNYLYGSIGAAFTLH